MGLRCVALASAVAAGLVGWTGSAPAQSPDDPFYDWELERYRILREPDSPSGAILPLPDRPCELAAPVLRATSLRLDAAGVTHPVAADEADGMRLREGARSRFWVDGLWPLPVGLRVGLAGRFTAGDGRRSGGTWLERSLIRSGEHTELLVGLTRSFWGDGNEGSLLLGQTAPPLEMVRLRSVRPWRLPRMGAYGRIHASVFLAYLDDRERTVSFPLLQGTRVEWEPSAWARLHATRTIMLGGAGRTEKLKLRDLWKIWLARGENARGKRDYRDTDQKASFGAELRLPASLRPWRWLDGGRVFYEYAGEDSFEGLLPTAVAHHEGISLIASGWGLLVEVVDNVDDSNPWYTHTTYGERAYYYRGYVLGHPMGTDGRSGHLRIWTPAWGAVRAQLWYRHREVDPHDRGVTARNEIVGLCLRRDLAGSRALEFELEAHRNPPVRWRAAVGLRWGSSGTPVSAASTAAAPEEVVSVAAPPVGGVWVR